MQYFKEHGGEHSDPLAIAQLNNGVVSNQSIVLAYADTARDTAYITLLFTPLVLLMRRVVRRATPGLGAAH